MRLRAATSAWSLSDLLKHAQDFLQAGRVDIIAGCCLRGDADFLFPISDGCRFQPVRGSRHNYCSSEKMSPSDVSGNQQVHDPTGCRNGDGVSRTSQRTFHKEEAGAIGKELSCMGGRSSV